jgi:hypothetical protein
MFGSSDIGLLFRISANTTDAKKELEELRAAVDRDSKSIKKDIETIDAPTGKTDGLISGYTKDVNILGTSVGTLSGVAAIGATAVAGIAIAAVGAGAALFALANNASAFASEINDANAKTGISTETLQALRFAASQGGVAFSEVSSSINKFAKTLGEAELGNKTAQESLKLLGVTSGDLETALGQAYKTILKYPEGADQMTASMRVFGKTSADLIPFVKEFDGSIAGVKQRAHELGLILDDEAIKSGDKFGDTIDLIGLQLKTTAARFALEFTPAFTKGLNYISTFLANNQGEVKQWGAKIGKVLDDTLKEINAKGGNFKAVGEVLAEKLGEGFTFGISKVLEAVGGYIGRRLKEIFTEGKIVD